MKKTLTILVLVISALNLKAQITLEHSFSSQGYPTRHFYTDDGIRYYSYNTSTNQLTLYNVDYSVYKTVTMSIAADYSFYLIFCVSDKLFNSNNSIEFIFVTYKTGADFSMKLFDENKNELKDFGNRSSAIIISENGVTKLNVQHLTYNSTFQSNLYFDEIYSLPGNLPSYVSTLKSSDIQQAYPNPSNSIINLPYILENGKTSIMNIYNSNGQLKEQKQIDSNFDKILLNVESYQSGVYTYEYNGISKRFIVN